MKTRRYRLLGAVLGIAAVLPVTAAFAEHHDHDGGRHGGDRGDWHDGDRRHDWHDGRLDWWGGIGPQWYYGPGYYDPGYYDPGYYDPAPVYPYPNAYVQPSIPAPVGPLWYYCAAPAGYYPYVGQCSVPWQAVTPR